MMTCGPDLADLAARLDRLERQNDRLARQNRRLKRAGVAFLVLTGAALLLGQATPGQAGPQKDDYVFSKSFVIRDTGGKMRVALGVFDGAAGFNLYDEDGVARARLFVDRDGPRFTLADKDGKRRVKLSLDDGEPVLALADGTEKTRVGLALRKAETNFDLTGEAAVRLSDSKGKQRVLLRAEGARSTLALGGAAGQVGVLLQVNAGGPSLGLLDEKGKVLFSRP